MNTKQKAVLFLILLSALALLPLGVRAENYQYLVDVRELLRERIPADSSDAFWTTARLDNAINKAIHDIEIFTECYEITDTVALSSQTYIYSAPDSMAHNGVLYAMMQKGGSNWKRQAQTITYASPNDFSKDQQTDVGVFTIINDQLLIRSTPTASDTLFVWGFRLSPELTTDSALISMPLKYRPFIVDLAWSDCLRMRGRSQEYVSARNQTLQELLAVKSRQRPNRESEPLGRSSDAQHIQPGGGY